MWDLQLQHVNSAAACGIQLPNQGLKPGCLLWEHILSHWTSREVPRVIFNITAYSPSPPLCSIRASLYRVLPIFFTQFPQFLPFGCRYHHPRSTPIDIANAGYIREVGLIPVLGRSLGGGHGNPLQYFCLENSMDRGAWQATVHRVAQSQTQQQKLSRHADGQLTML